MSTVWIALRSVDVRVLCYGPKGAQNGCHPMCATAGVSQLLVFPWLLYSLDDSIGFINLPRTLIFRENGPLTSAYRRHCSNCYTIKRKRNQRYYYTFLITSFSIEAYTSSHNQYLIITMLPLLTAQLHCKSRQEGIPFTRQYSVYDVLWIFPAVV